MGKYYSAEDAIKMLPYLRSYAKDIKQYNISIQSLTKRAKFLSSLVSVSKDKQAKINKLREKIRHKIKILNLRIDRWEKELKELFIRICDVSRGRLDVPVYLYWMEALVYFCVLPETTEQNIEWHFDAEPYEKARRYHEYTTQN